MPQKIVVITGASGGLGGATARAFAAAGWGVAAGFYRRESRARELIGDLEGGGHFILPIKVDDSESVNRAAQIVAARGGTTAHGGAAALINNAGVTRFVEHADLAALDDELIDAIFRIHCRGALACVRAFLPQLRAARGCVVNITSVAAEIAVGSNVAYCAAKAALENITRSLARALAPQVRVCALAPGLVDTDFIRGLDPKWREAQIAKTPLGRLLTPAEVGAAALAIADDLSFCTGATIALDGGRPLL